MNRLNTKATIPVGTRVRFVDGCGLHRQGFYAGIVVAHRTPMEHLENQAQRLGINLANFQAQIAEIPEAIRHTRAPVVALDPTVSFPTPGIEICMSPCQLLLGDAPALSLSAN